MNGSSDRTRFDLRGGMVGVLVAAAALLLGFSAVGWLGDPSGIYRLDKTAFVKPETLNVQLNWLQGTLAPIDRLLPPDAALSYVGNEEAFAYFQAVLAPRRIAPDLDAPFILLYAEPGERPALPDDLREARLLARLSPQIDLLQRAGAP